MTNDAHKADISGAVAALSAVVNSMEQRRAKLDVAIETARLERGRKLDSRVADLLPNISSSTLATLKKEAFAFAADRKVKDAFANNGKIAWLIKKPGYDKAIILLRTQLKTFLERSGYVAADDATLVKQEADRAALAAQQSEAMEMLGLMQRAHLSSRPVPPEAAKGINAMAQRGRILAMGGSRQIGAVRSSSRNQPPQPDHPSDDDVWFWMMTDIPTSFRTVMLNQFAGHHTSGGGGSFAGGGAQGAWSSQEDQPSNLQPGQADRGSMAGGYAAGFVANQMTEDSANQMPSQPQEAASPASNADDQDQVQSPTQPDPAIATDDKLGVFS
jgi:hypothetical protein